MIWILFALLGLVSAFVMFRGNAAAAPQDNQAALIFKSQLQELGRELQDGLIGEEEAKAARIEIEKRLATALRNAGDGASLHTRPRSLLIGAALLVLGASLAIYTQLGRPDLSPSPVAQSIPPVTEGVDEMIARLEDRLKATPDDVEGWRRLGWAQSRLQRFTESIAAYEKALALAPDDAEVKSELAEALTMAAAHQVPPRARALFEEALKLNAKDTLAAYRLAMADEQSGAFEAALERWRGLAATEGLQASNRELVRRRLIALAEKTGQDIAASLALLERKEEAPAQTDMSQIDGMIAGLAQRLVDDPSDLDGWKMLIRSLHVRQGPEAARGAFAQAEKIFAGRDEPLKDLQSLMGELGLR